MVRHFITILFFAYSSIAVAQVLNYATPEKLPATINSEAEETFPIISPDGRKMFFVRALSSNNIGGKFTGHDVWSSDWDGQVWSKATNKNFVFNDENNSAVVGVNAEGNVIYLLESSANKKINGISFSRKKSGSWTKSEFIPIPGLEGYSSIGFFVSSDFTAILISMRGKDSKGEEDLYVSLKSSMGWSTPKNLGPVINTKGFEISPFLTTDKKRLYFASNGHEGSGDADIFYCDRLYDSWETWSSPRNLGTKVNSDKFDAYFSIYGDTIAYFASNRSTKATDIYSVRVYPGDELYAITQRYLTEREMNETLGGKVSRKIVFEKNETELSAGQKELLYFIANKLLHRVDINFHIVVNEENDPQLSSKRQASVYDFLRQSGIEGHRIQIMTGKARTTSKSNNAVVEIILFR
jgi:hypothetical protein